MTLSSNESKAWGKLVIGGISNAMSGLSKMVMEDIRINSLSVRLIPVKDIPLCLGGPDNLVIGIYQAFSGSAHGHLMLVCQPAIGFTLSDMIMGNPPGTTNNISDIDQSALGEMGNVTGTYFLNAVADTLGLTLVPTPPIVMCDIADSILEVALAETPRINDGVLIAETEFCTRNRSTKGIFLVIANPDFMRTVIDRSSRLSGI